MQKWNSKNRPLRKGKPTRMISSETVSLRRRCASGHLLLPWSLAAQAAEALLPPDPHTASSATRAPIRKFERIVMCGCRFLVDLPKDCRPVVGCLRIPPEKAIRQDGNFAGEGQFRSRHQTHRQFGIIGGGEAACPGAEVLRRLRAAP